MIEDIAITVGLIIYGGVWWRFRGGAFTAITGLDPGTGGMRAISAGFMGGAIAALTLNYYLLLLIPALWIGWSIAGWGHFQDMGKVKTKERDNWLSDAVGYLTTKQPYHDFIGMAFAGMICLMPCSLVIKWITSFQFFVFTGILFAPCYLIAQYLPRVPDFGKFAPAEFRNAFAEILVGACVLPLLYWSCVQ